MVTSAVVEFCTKMDTDDSLRSKAKTTCSGILSMLKSVGDLSRSRWIHARVLWDAKKDLVRKARRDCAIRETTLRHATRVVTSTGAPMYTSHYSAKFAPKKVAYFIFRNSLDEGAAATAHRARRRCTQRDFERSADGCRPTRQGPPTWVFQLRVRNLKH